MTDRRKRGHDSRRSTILLVSIILGLLVVGGRLVYLQVVAAPAFAQRATDQRLRDMTLSPKRGAIYDREGEPLAVTTEACTVYATPQSIDDPVGTSAAIAAILGEEPDAYVERLSRDTSFVYVARKLDVDRAAALRDLDLQGIDFIDDSRRVYPSGELACQVLGFVGVDDEGLAGLEKQYDELLAGVPGSILAERDPSGRVIPGGVMSSVDPTDGQDIVLTIDKDIQYQAQLEITAAVEKWNAVSGSVIVMNPQNGEIYAMATAPGFNPNDFGSSEAYTHRNRPITDSYEPGSTVKSLTAAAIISEGLYGPNDMFELPPTIQVADRTIKESHSRPTVNWSLADIVINSSNVGSVMLGLELGEEGLFRYLDGFGLSERTGVDFPGEGMGSLPPVDQWSGSTIGTIPFGQGVSMTPLQLARALASIANGGELPTPHFLRELPDQPDASLVWPARRVLTEDAARTTTSILERVVTEGTGSEAAVPGYEVAGKTGTAQKARTDGRTGYARDKYIASFSGFLPAGNPQVLILVMLDEPSNAIYGGTVAAPTFAKLAQFSVSHLKIPPTSSVPEAENTASQAPHADDSSVSTGSPQSGGQ